MLPRTQIFRSWAHCPPGSLSGSLLFSILASPHGVGSLLRPKKDTPSWHLLMPCHNLVACCTLAHGERRKRSLTFRASSPVLMSAFSMPVSTFACFYASASSHATGQPKREEGQGTRPQTRLASKKHKGTNSQSTSNQRPRKTARANQNARIRKHPPASICSDDLLCSGLCSEHNQNPFSELHLTRARRTAPLSLGSQGVSDIEIEPLAEGGVWRDTP